MARISVVVPVYKVEKYLNRCVDSILGQTFADLELVLVDDGSPDDCGAICDAYARRESRVHVLHTDNGGLSAARNTGIEWVLNNSDSQWITFVDSDDWIHKDYLQRLYTAVMDTDCKIAACTFYLTQGASEEPQESMRAQRLSADDYYCSDTITAIPIACGKLYEKSLFADLRYPEKKLHEDEFTTYRAVYASGSVAYIPDALYAYFQNSQGIIHSRWHPGKLHILQAFEQQIQDAKRMKLERLYRKAVRDYIYSIHEQLQASDADYHGKLRKKYREALKLGRESGVFPVCWDLLWAYEEAYPAKVFWWPLFKGKHLLDRLIRKDQKV